VPPIIGIATRSPYGPTPMLNFVPRVTLAVYRYVKPGDAGVAAVTLGMATDRRDVKILAKRILLAGETCSRDDRVS
jgi:hypothetical protein